MRCRACARRGALRKSGSGKPSTPNRQEVNAAALVIFYDEDTEVYVNGELIWKRTGFTTRYDAFVVTEALRKALKSGANTLAVHTRQTAGGQFIDLALLIETAPAKLSARR